MRKPKPIGPLSSLAPDQKETLRAWFESLTYEQIQARIALPPPDGFGLTVSPWQLRRYYQRLSLDDPSAPPDAPAISSILDQAAFGQDVFTPATIHLLEKRSFELACVHEDPQKIRAVFGLVLKSRDTATRERLTELQKQKLALRRQIPQQSLEQNPSSFPFPDEASSSSIPA